MSRTKAGTGPQTASSGDRDPRPAPGRKPGRPSNAEKRVEKLGDSLREIGLSVAIIYPADGVLIAERADSVAEAFGTLAEENEAVRRWLDRGIQGSAWVGVVMAVAPIALGIAANHGVFGASPAGAGAIGDVVSMFGTGGAEGGPMTVDLDDLAAAAGVDADRLGDLSDLAAMFAGADASSGTPEAAG